MAPRKNKHTALHDSLVLFLGLYLVALIAAGFVFRASWEWLFFGLIPTSAGLLIAITSYREGHRSARHLERHLTALYKDQRRILQLLAAREEEDNVFRG